MLLARCARCFGTYRPQSKLKFENGKALLVQGKTGTLQKGIFAVSLVGLAFFARRTWMATGWIGRIFNLGFTGGFGAFSSFLYSASKNSIDKLYLKDNGRQLEIQTAIFGRTYHIDIEKIAMKADDPTMKMMAATSGSYILATEDEEMFCIPMNLVDVNNKEVLKEVLAGNTIELTESDKEDFIDI